MKKIFTLFFCFLAAVFLCYSLNVNTVNAENMKLTSKSAVLMNCDGEVLFEHNKDERRPIASMVKIMTLLLCFENIDANKISIEDEVVASERAASMGGSQAFLDAGASYKVENLIKSVIIASANDSCVALAETISGSVEGFVEQMNKKAADLGMTNTVFTNCTGLPMAGQFSTANDVGIMFSQLIKHKKYFEYANIWMDDFLHPSGRVTGLTNTNKLIRQYNGCDGGKTGYTAEAGHCLAATAKRNGTRLISVIVGGVDSKTRFSENKALFDYGFANFESKLYLSAEKPIEQKVKVIGGKQNELSVKLEKDLTCFGRKGQSAGEIVLELPEKVKAPVIEGDEIGYAHVVVNGKKVASVKVIAAQSVKKATFWDYLKNMVK